MKKIQNKNKEIFQLLLGIFNKNFILGLPGYMINVGLLRRGTRFFIGFFFSKEVFRLDTYLLREFLSLICRYTCLNLKLQKRYSLNLKMQEKKSFLSPGNHLNQQNLWIPSKFWHFCYKCLVLPIVLFVFQFLKPVKT